MLIFKWVKTMKQKNYKKRIADELINMKIEVFGALNIVGPKGCGKTETASQRCKTIIAFQDEDKRENLLKVANTQPSNFTKESKPVLFDEWQDAPKIWGTVRTYCDNHPEELGSFYLTGSSAKNVKVPHTGTLRIANLKMLPMSLYETGESNGKISLMDLFNDPSKFNGCKTNTTLDDLIYALCRGGWPRYLYAKTKNGELLVAKELYEQTYTTDISSVDGITRDPEIAKLILRSYARNICTLADNRVIIGDVNSNHPISEATYYDYISALKKLYIVDDLEAWCPAIRSKSAIRSGVKRNIIDPSIAVAALGASPQYFSKDFKTLGFLFESLCIRDLKVYSSSMNGTMSYYHDRYGLEADGVLHLEDGRYALLEFKLGESEVPEASEHLCEIERLIIEYNKKEKQCPLRLPDLKIIVTGTQYGYKDNNGVFVIPLACLKN